MELCHEQGVELDLPDANRAGWSRGWTPRRRATSCSVASSSAGPTDPKPVRRLARSFVAGKLHNARTRSSAPVARPTTPTTPPSFERAASLIGEHIEALPQARRRSTRVRGHEGDAARVYFEVFPRLIRPSRRGDFPMNGRSRRPPLDRVNALLSFIYALMTHDCVSALTAAA